MDSNHLEKRGTLGDSFDDFNGLEHNVLHYHDTNTLIAWGLLAFCGIAYGVVTNTLLYDFIETYLAIS